MSDFYRIKIVDVHVVKFTEGGVVLRFSVTNSDGQTTFIPEDSRPLTVGEGHGIEFKEPSTDGHGDVSLKKLFIDNNNS